MTTTRRAIYFAPEAGSGLEAFGRLWLGPISDDHDVQSARHYGFHATLKPPFRLDTGSDRDSLLAACAQFAARREAFVIPPLVLRDEGGFLALRPRQPDPRLQLLADDAVRAFDPFRAPMTEAERQKRRSVPLSARQTAYLERWGYPYVFEDFHFHMTLTGSVGPLTVSLLQRLWAPFADEPVLVGSICLFEQEGPAPFALTQRFPFLG